MKKKIIAFSVFILAAIVFFFVLRAYLEKSSETAAVKDREELFKSFGLTHSGKSPFVSLPPFLAHNSAAARLGSELFRDDSFTRTPKRVCAACHALNEGGTDGKIRKGIITRPVYNAVFSTVFMHDGSVTNYTDAVRTMIEGRNFCGGAPLSNIVEKMSKDPKMIRKFQVCYDDGVTEKNFLDAFSQYNRTLITSSCKFDLYFGGDTNVFNASETRGIKIFERQRCADCHNGPALGGRKIYDGRKVSPLRGISNRKVFLQKGTTPELSSVLIYMPGGDLETSNRIDLVNFLKTM